MKRLILTLLASCGAVYAQQNALLLPWTPQQFTNTNGTVLANGKVCTYLAGTSTGVATYTDSTASVANNIPPNAILLDSTGRANIWLKPTQAYKIVVLTAGSDNTCNTGVTIKTQDNVGLGASVTANNTFSGTNTFTGTTSVLNLNNVQFCDQFAGATADAKITACIAALPAAGGIANAEGIIGSQSFASTLVINKTITLKLGAVRITGPASGDMIDVSTQGVIIRGIGSMQNTGATQGTVLVPVTSAQAHCINFQASATQYVVADLSITDSTAGGTSRTAGDGIRASANASPAQNSIGKVDNVYISFMFNGINLIRPITTTVNHATMVQNKNDGFRAQGDGTSTWCTQCYSNHSGRHNYSFWGMNYSGTLEGASDNANADGYRVDNCQNDGATCPGGNTQSLAMTISGGAELDCINGGASCAGVHLLDAIGVELLGQKVLNSHGYGIWINGARGVAAHGFVTGSTSNDIQADCSGTPQCASGFLFNNLIYTTSGGVQINSGLNIIGWTGGGGGASNLFATANPVQLFENATPSGVAASDVLYGDSTAHLLRVINNNGTAGPLVTAAPCNTSQKTETAGDANVLTCTIPAQAGSYRLRFVLSLSAANAATLGWTATWTDSNGNAQTPTNLEFFQLGTSAPTFTYTTSAAGNYYGYADIDVNNAGVAIVVKLTFSGTSFTGKASATIERII